MDNRGYQKALDCFERIWKEGIAEGKWQDDENLKTIFYDWFVTGWILRVRESEEFKKKMNIMCYYGGMCDSEGGLCYADCPRHKENCK